MSWFNRYVVGAFSPRRALMRERYAKGLRAYYEAAEPSRMRKTRTDLSTLKTEDFALLRQVLLQTMQEVAS